MSLPDLIEIIPLAGPVRAEITVPGSKSITNRALILAALAEGEVTLRGALWSEDTQVMVECLQELGFMVNVAPDANESCNRTITVYGLGGAVPRGGTEAQPLELFVGNAGTAARFLAAFVCLGSGAYRLHGIVRMHERPQAALFAALRELGYRVDSPNDKLPAVIHGEGKRQKAKGKSACGVSVTESSQFASALLLCAGVGGWDIEITGANEDEMPYVTMTRELVKVFPACGGEFQIEPDASSGSYFWAAGGTAPTEKNTYEAEDDAGNTVLISGQSFDWTVRVRDWPASSWQIDARFPQSLSLLLSATPGEFATDSAEELAEKHGKEWRQTVQSKPMDGIESFAISRATDLGDSIMTAIVVAPFAIQSFDFTDLGRLRVQECERVVALRTELTRCGAKVVEAGDTLTVYPSQLHGAEIETYNDHRMAMCFAVLGLKVPGIKIKNPACVKKTFPNFFQKLAAAPPHGLGAEIRDARTGRRLALDELFAD